MQMEIHLNKLNLRILRPGHHHLNTSLSGTTIIHQTKYPGQQKSEELNFYPKLVFYLRPKLLHTAPKIDASRKAYFIYLLGVTIPL